MPRRGNKFLVLLFLLLLSFGWRGEAVASSFRCGQEIVKTGDSTAEVLTRCGKPTFVEEAASIRRGAGRSAKLDAGEGLVVKKRRFTESTQRVENWYYDRGTSEFVYVLTFIGGVLSNIKTEGYGTVKGREATEQGNASLGESGSRQRTPLSPPEEVGRKATTGRIDLIGSPAGARVYLDGYYSGNLPCIIEGVEAGSYGLEVRQEGFKEWKERILVKADSTLGLMIHLESELQEKEGPSAGDAEGASQKKLYKWTDPSGRIHITDTPPPGE